MNIIEINNLTKTYKALDFWKRDRYTAIKDINLEIKKGEVFGLLGLNGAGKTTLMKVILGLLYPTSGSVSIFGGSIQDMQVRKRIGYWSELPYFPKYLKTSELLDYFAEIFDVPSDQRKIKIQEMLEITGLSAKKNERIKNLSKGMQGRLGLAQALINDPDLLLLDEPMSGLDPLGHKETRDILINLNKKGKTIFFNSHILSEVEKICDRVAVLYMGTLADVKPISAVQKKHKNLEDYFISVINKEVMKTGVRPAFT